MKNTLVWILLSLVLSSCSLFSRHADDGPGPSTDKAENAAPSLESEVARLNTKISALETKLDVLSSNMERMEMKRSQPIIEAEPVNNSEPQPNIAAPVEISENPLRPKALPSMVKGKTDQGTVEKEFKVAMSLFQSGKNPEAAAKFAEIAKKHPGHLLAGHSLYWAGEASARSEEWSQAIENWTELEQNYSRTAYLPEALAGLSKAYQNQGNPAKARNYRDTLLRAFPKSPVTLTYAPPPAEVVKPKKPQPLDDEAVPTYQDSEKESDRSEE